MSKLPKISAHNSDSFKTALGLVNNGNDIYKMIPEKENNDYTQNNPDSDINPLPIIPNKFANTINLGQKTLMPLIAEARMNELETKLINMEQSNNFMKDKLKSYERNFEVQLKQMQQSIMGEKDNREKVEKLLGMLTDQSSISSNELKNKMALMEEVIEKEEKFKYQQRQNDIELYKNLINKLTDKVAETVRLEIDARFKADMDNKAMTQTMAQKIFAEVDEVRKEMDELQNGTRSEIRETAKECSERAHNLSKYIDQKISEALINPNQGMEKMRNFVSKLTDQVKINMSSQNSQNKIFEGKIANFENFNTQIKEEIYKFVGAVEERLLRKFTQLKNYTDINVRNNFENLNGRINELSKNTDKNVMKLADQLIDTRNHLNNSMKVMKKEQSTQFNALVEDIEALASRLYSYEDLLADYNKLNQATKVKIENDMAAMQSKFEVNTVNERMMHKIEIDEVGSEIDKIKDDLVDFGQKVHNDMNDMMNNFEANHKNLFDRSKLTFEQMNRMAESNIQMFEEFEQTVHKIHEETEKIELNNLMNSMLNRIEENNVYSEINKCKDVEYYLHQNVHNLDEELKRVNNALFEYRNQIEVQELMKEMLDRIDSNEIKNRQNEMMDTFERNEAELIESIRKLDEKVEDNIEKRVQGDQELEEKIENLNLEIELLKNRPGNPEEIKPDDKADMSPLNQEELDKIRAAIDKQNEEIQVHKRLIKEVDVKLVTEEMLNKIEFDTIYALIHKKFLINDEKNNQVLEKLTEFNKQIYKIDKEFSDTNETTMKVLKDYNEIIEAKINAALERIKKDNVDMWVNAVELSQKVNQPEEIRKIIQQVPPVVIPKEDSKLRLYELENEKNKQPKPELLKFKGGKGKENLNKPQKDKDDEDHKDRDNKDPNSPKEKNNSAKDLDKGDKESDKPNSSNKLDKDDNKSEKSNNSGGFKQDPNDSNKNTDNIR